MAGGPGGVSAVDAGDAHGGEALRGEEGRREGVGGGLEEAHRGGVDAEGVGVGEEALDVAVAAAVGVELLEGEHVDGPEGFGGGGGGREGEEELSVVDADFSDAAPHPGVDLDSCQPSGEECRTVVHPALDLMVVIFVISPDRQRVRVPQSIHVPFKP